MSDQSLPETRTEDAETVARLLHDPTIRDRLVVAISRALAERRPTPWWRRLGPLTASASSALVLILAFFIPSIQDQWDRFQSRKVIQRYVALGEDFLKERRYKLAEEAFSKALELSEGKRLDIEQKRLSAKVQQINADPTWGTKNPKGLEESDFLYLLHFQKPEGMEGDRAATLNSYGAFLAGANRLREAEAAIRESISLNPNASSSHLYLGNVLWDTRRVKDAEAEYRKAAQLNPKDARAHFNLGLLLVDTERGAEAEPAFRKAFQLDPGDRDTLQELVSLLERQGKTAEARQILAEIQRLDAGRGQGSAPAALRAGSARASTPTPTPGSPVDRR